MVGVVSHHLHSLRLASLQNRNGPMVQWSEMQLTQRVILFPTIGTTSYLRWFHSLASPFCNTKGINTINSIHGMNSSMNSNTMISTATTVVSIAVLIRTVLY